MNSDIMRTYDTFIDAARPYLNIENEKDYQEALNMLEELLEAADDSENDHNNPLIDLLSASIERYESQDPETLQFIEESERYPQDIALLRTLMSTYNLTGSDFPEIGTKSMVSKILSGKRTLSRSAIEQLSVRFGLQPAMFF